MDTHIKQISDNAIAFSGILVILSLLYTVVPPTYWGYVNTSIGVMAGFSFGRQLAWRYRKGVS